MPYKQMPQFKSVPEKVFDIPQPGIGGLNLRDLEFEQEVNQSPYMKNVMYRNGAFAKRYGQETLLDDELASEEILSITYFDGKVFIHSGTSMRAYDYSTGDVTPVPGTLPESKGYFIHYAQKLYYLVSAGADSGIYEYKKEGPNEGFSLVEAYVPETKVNCRPDGTHSDDLDDFNVIGLKFTHVYNGTSGTTVYKVYDDKDVIDWSVAPVVKVEGVTTSVTVSQANKTITFATAPPAGELNVEVTWTMQANLQETVRNQVFSCKYYDTFGGSNNSCLFLAGCGYSKYFYSNPFDISYFPDNNFGTLGNTEEDIIGFGRQYNVLIVFKPREVYSIYSFTYDSSNTLLEEKFGTEGFKSRLVNPRVGCDCPNTIQLINNQLTWFNSSEGVCTLVSTNIQDERNVRPISRNIDRTNNFGVTGILDQVETDKTKICSVDFDNKYFLVFPTSGMAYVWDYEISPYHFTSSGETPPSKLDWYLFDHFYVNEFLRIGKDLIYSSRHSRYLGNLVRLNMTFADLDFNNEGEPDAIESYYMTPFLQFGSVESLKTVKNIFVQCRGDTATKIDMWYYDEQTILGEGEQESESILIGGRLWRHFAWTNLTWYIVGWASTFRRKCNLKKVQMASFFFKNDEVDRDMSITHIGMQYQLVKYIR